MVTPLAVFATAEPSWVIGSNTYGGTDSDQAYSLVKTAMEDTPLRVIHGPLELEALIFG